MTSASSSGSWYLDGWQLSFLEGGDGGKGRVEQCKQKENLEVHRPHLARQV